MEEALVFKCTPVAFDKQLFFFSLSAFIAESSFRGDLVLPTHALEIEMVHSEQFLFKGDNKLILFPFSLPLQKPTLFLAVHAEVT